MKAMRIILVAVYVILIILLLLTNCIGRCHLPNPQPDNEGGQTEEEIIEQAQQTGQDGELKITLMWNFYADIDLHVIEPNGNEIYFSEKQSSTGGFLDVDNVDGGPRSAENIYWRNPRPGTYQVLLVYYAENSGWFGNRVTEGNCNVVVFNKNQEPQTYTVHLAPSQRGDRISITNVTFEP